MIEIADLAKVNAGLNALSAILLLIGYVFIRQRRVDLHRLCMLGAFATSTLFLISYVIYHLNVGSVPFTGQGTVRTLYFTVLISHTILAVLVPPLAIVTLVRALRERFDQHRKIAKWTLPIWLYVSLTGVVVYMMLYGL